MLLLAFSLFSCRFIDSVIEKRLVKRPCVYTSFVDVGEKIDFTKNKWLIASYDPDEIYFFEDILGDRLQPVYKVQETYTNLPFNISCQSSLDDLNALAEVTGANYLICIKHGREAVKAGIDSNRILEYLQVSTLSIYNLVLGEIEHQIVCTSKSDEYDNRLYNADTRYDLWVEVEKHAEL